MLTKQPNVASSIPCHGGMCDGRVKNEGHIAPIMQRTVNAPFIVWIANQKVARMTRETIATYEPQKPQAARAMTGNGAWWMTPVAPLNAIWDVTGESAVERIMGTRDGPPARLTTMDMMKKLRATTAILSRHVSPTAMTLAPNCHVAALKASEIQYAMKLVTPHFLSCGGTGSRSLLVLFTFQSMEHSTWPQEGEKRELFID